MLVLTRKIGEKIVIPGLEMEIQVLKIGGRQVALGITAPPEIKVHREEIARREGANHFPPANPALACLEEAIAAVNSQLQKMGKNVKWTLRAKRHLRAALCDLIISQELPACADKILTRNKK